MVTDVIKEQIVMLVRPGEIFLRVIDYMIGADRSDKVEISGAATPVYFRAVRLGDLDSESSDTAGELV
jgi:hypothetical protein